MAINYTTDALITLIRTLPSMPSVQSLFSDEKILSFMNLQISTTIFPLIDSVSEEYYVYFVDNAYDQTVFTYDIPERSVGGKIRDVVFLDNNGFEYSIPRLRPEDLKNRYPIATNWSTPALYGFYVKDNVITLYLGTLTGTSTYPFIRFKILRRPSMPVLKSAAGLISAINTTTKEVTCTSVPTTWTTSTVFDFVKGKPNFASKGDDKTITNITSNTLTFTDDLPDDLIVGDWIAEAGETPIPQVPYDAFSLLAQLTAVKCLEVAQDMEGWNVAKEEAEIMKTALLNIITPRVDGSQQKLTSPGGIFSSNW